MKNHIVSTENYRHYFKEVDDIDVHEVNQDCLQIYGQAETVTDFLNNSDVESWINVGYSMRYVYRPTGSKYFTAFLYRLGQPFTMDQVRTQKVAV